MERAGGRADVSSFMRHSSEFDFSAKYYCAFVRVFITDQVTNLCVRIFQLIEDISCSRSRRFICHQQSTSSLPMPKRFSPVHICAACRICLLFSQPRLGFPGVTSPWCFPTNNMTAFPVPLLLVFICLVYLILLLRFVIDS